MGRSDFEKEIQRKLQEREIVPSDKAWEKLNAQLPQKKAKKGSTWYWVAAAVIILIFAGVFMNNSKNEHQKPAVVNTKRENQETIQPKPSQEIKEDVIVRNEVPEPLRQIEEKKIIPESNNAVTATHKIEKEIEIPEEFIIETAEEKKVTEVVSYLETLQNSGKEITEAMVDSLLIQAQRELALERTFNDPTGKVDAMALLNEVEKDLDKSFRDKIFEALEDGFIVIKTAVADSN